MKARFAIFLAFSAAFLAPAALPAAVVGGSAKDLRGMAIIKMGCSGVLVNLNRSDDRPAVLLTNGHCSDKDFLRDGEVLVNHPWGGGITNFIYGASDQQFVWVSKVLYGTMTDSDIALVELEKTYADLKARGAIVYSLSARDPALGTKLQVVSGLWKQKQTCSVEAIVPTLREGNWKWINSFRLDSGCKIQGGWSGSPMFDPATREIFGVINSGYDGDAKPCAENNPCEIDSNGKKTVLPKRGYAQRISDLLSCVSITGEIDLTLPSCSLRRP